jgi:hypothetical protein
MNHDDLNAVLAGLRQQVLEAHKQLAEHKQPLLASPQGSHYAALVHDMAQSLPQIEKLYADHREEILKGPLVSGRKRLRFGRNAQQADVHRIVHDLRHDYLEIIHPLEVMGKWPPQRRRSGETEELPRARGIGKWPPDPV